MDDWTSSTYGDRFADRYDERYDAVLGDVTPAIDLLEEIAGDGPALELGIGTGRIALPLAQRGIPVEGIDASEAIVAKLRDKPGGSSIPVRIGDFADVDHPETFGLIYIVFNTLFALTSQDEQVRCFRNVAGHLSPGGRFLLEAFVPDLRRFDAGQATRTLQVGLDRVRVEHSLHRATSQLVESVEVVHTTEGSELFPVTIRYAYPPELDLMAKLAGMHLVDRWGGWDRSPFSDDSTGHVSVWTVQG